jgi:hypothetical protein
VFSLDLDLNVGRALHRVRFRDKDRLILIRNLARLEVLAKLMGSTWSAVPKVMVVAAGNGQRLTGM